MSSHEIGTNPQNGSCLPLWNTMAYGLLCRGQPRIGRLVPRLYAEQFYDGLGQERRSVFGAAPRSREEWDAQSSGNPPAIVQAKYPNIRCPRSTPCCNMLAPPGGFARLGTRSTVTTCDDYPKPFVVLVVMVLILLCFFHIKCGCSQVDFISFFSDAIDHWMFWQCPNLSFFRQIWRKNQQSPVIYSVSIWHDLHTYIDRHEVYIHIYIYHIHQK